MGARYLFLVAAASNLLCACSSSDPPTSHPEVDPQTAASGAVSADATASAMASSTPASATVSSSSSAPAPSASATAEVEAPPIPKGVKVLLIGDSFAEALGAGLKSKESSTGIKFVLRGEKATYIPEWAGPNRGVAGMMIMDKPNLVVIALGGNELSMVNPEVRGPKVKQLVGLLKDTPCVWVTPPLWADKKDNGLLQIIRQNSAPCRFFDSDVLSPNLPRGGDKIHPTGEGQKKWAGYFLDWLRKERVPTGAGLELKPRPAAE